MSSWTSERSCNDIRMQSRGQGDVLKGQTVTTTFMDVVKSDTTEVVMVVEEVVKCFTFIPI